MSFKKPEELWRLILRNDKKAFLRDFRMWEEKRCKYQILTFKLIKIAQVQFLDHYECLHIYTQSHEQEYLKLAESCVIALVSPPVSCHYWIDAKDTMIYI